MDSPSGKCRIKPAKRRLELFRIIAPRGGIDVRIHLPRCLYRGAFERRSHHHRCSNLDRRIHWLGAAGSSHRGCPGAELVGLRNAVWRAGFAQQAWLRGQPVLRQRRPASIYCAPGTECHHRAGHRCWLRYGADHRLPRHRLRRHLTWRRNADSAEHRDYTGLHAATADRCDGGAGGQPHVLRWRSESRTRRGQLDYQRCNSAFGQYGRGGDGGWRRHGDTDRDLRLDLGEHCDHGDGCQLLGVGRDPLDPFCCYRPNSATLRQRALHRRNHPRRDRQCRMVLQYPRRCHGRHRWHGLDSTRRRVGISHRGAANHCNHPLGTCRCKPNR
jgi:hypothetical protein